MVGKTALISVLALLFLLLTGAVADSGYDELIKEGERFYAEKSFSRAHEVYARIAKLELTPTQRRWVEFRLADTQWRGTTNDDEAIRKLNELVRGSERDIVFAEAQESLGDYALQRHGDWMSHYNLALDWWAGSDNIPLARARYLNIVWKIEERASYSIPRDVLVNAIRIANTPEDRAHARFLLAQQLLMHERHNPASLERALELFEEIINEGANTQWYDDALFLYASSTPDYVKALRYYDLLIKRFTNATSPFHNDAIHASSQIQKPMVAVMVPQTYLPEAEQDITLTWRNVKQIEVAIHAVDLTAEVTATDNDAWHEKLPLGESVRRFTHQTNDTGELKPGAVELPLSPKLPPGAYVVVARAGTESARALLLVTDAHILVHTSSERMHVFVSDVETGEPIANARVRVASIHSRQKFSRTVQTNADGLADITINESANVIITAHAGAARQAWHSTYAYSHRRGNEAQWRVYAFTDRPAYRPEETVQWKIIARARENERWITPANASLTYEITGPRGEKVANGTAKLNAFGSFWGELALTPQMALGAYTITFRDTQRVTGAAQLFRLEEYKLPEFVVNVSTNEKEQYRLGDTIEATIEASYYFGGPVATAEVEVVVHQQPFHRYWYPWRHYDWYWPRPPQYQHESVITRETLRTDAEGRAIVRIPTQRDANDTSYRIEARVVDASRREVRGEGTVRVTKQRYTVLAHAEHYLHRPGDSVSVQFKAMDANDRPVQTNGTVTVTRRRWQKRVYVDEQVTTSKLATNARGEATFTFTPRETGYYVVRWESFDGDPSRAQNKVVAETTVWVADRDSTDIGYYSHGGVDIIVDKEAARAGETVPVMIATGTSGRWVVLTTSGDEILDTRVLRLDGNVKLVQLQLDERHVPNFFLTASSIFDLGVHTDTEQIVVPPVEHFINVDVKADREQYEPRQTGTLTITTKDVDGRPVPAEVAVAVSDEAVTAIQQDTAGDPRQFFYGELRHQRVQVSAALHSQQYQRKEEREEGEPVSAVGHAVGGVAGGTVGTREFAADAVQEAITVTASAPQMKAMATAAPPPPAPAPVAPPPAEAPPGIDVQVRSDFRSTAFWKPDVVTDASGVATVKVQFPEALTTWRATARAVTTGASFGMGTSTAKTNLPLLVRLQGPRFFVVGDRVVVSGVVNNNTDAAITVTPTLEVEGLTLQSKAEPLRVEAHGEARADWTVLADKAGEAKLRVTARGTNLGDAMEKSFIVYEHGIDKLIARSGKMRGGETLVKLELPRERRATDLTMQVAPTLAVAMLDALPYLLEFPYGCTEQTMSRFLPAAIVARTLAKLGLDPDDRLPKKQLDAVTSAGMARLYDMQHASGAWGWWKEGSDDPFMTAYVIWGFALARDGGLPVRTQTVDRAAAWLSGRLTTFERDPQSQAWMLHALSAWSNRAGAAEQRAVENIWKNRERLTSYARALFALSVHRYGDAEKARVLVRNLEDNVKLERGDGAAETMATARWGSEQRYWWHWYDSPVETTAFVLQALVTIDPQHRLVEPAMNWLVKNRRGAAWSNTRDTAISLLALNDYLVRSGELQGDVSYEVTVNGRVIASKTIAKADVLKAPSRFSVDPAILNATTQEVRIRRTSGDAPIYFAAEARFVSLEEPVTAAANELAVKREYFRLAPRPTLLKGVLYDRVPLRDGESIDSGERIEVVATVDAKNDYSYLIFEDLKPGGFEAVELQSGQALYATNAENGSVWVYQELRDRKVAMFIDRLPQGVWQIKYTLRAETPGYFHALPLIGQAMYAPEIRGNGDEVRVTVNP